MNGISWCKEASAESLGNAAKYQYSTSTALAAGAACAGHTVVSKSKYIQRCVASEGTVNGVKPGTRLQVLVEAPESERLFTVKGIVGLEEILVSGSVKLPAVAASNGKINSEGSAWFECGYELCTTKGAKIVRPHGRQRTHEAECTSAPVPKAKN